MNDITHQIGGYEIDALQEIYRGLGLEGVLNKYSQHIILRHLQQRGVVSEERDLCIKQLMGNTDMDKRDIVKLVNETKSISKMLPEYTLQQNQKLDLIKSLHENHTHMEYVDGRVVGIIPDFKENRFDIMDLTNKNEIKLGVVMGDNLSINWNSNWMIGDNLLRWATHKVREIRKWKEQGVLQYG